MAQLILSAAGAVAGSFIPGVGPMMGWAIGSMLGGAMAPTQKVQGQQQQLMDLRILGTEYGQAIPYVIGSASIAGQMWWNTDRRPTTTTTTTTSGGKGGGGTEVTSSTISYDMDCLIGLSDNEIVGVARIWMNGALIYTADAGASDSSVAASAASDQWKRLTVYTGAVDQLPDPTYEAAVGMGNAPAYRGRGYAFIEGLKLGQSGQVPNLTFEVVASGSVASLDAVYAAFDAAKGTNAGAHFGTPNYMTQIPPYVTTGRILDIASLYWGSWGSAAPTLFKSTGKYYCEFQLLNNPGGVGICNESWRPADWDINSDHPLGQDANSYGIYPRWISGIYQGAFSLHNGIETHLFGGPPYFQNERVGLMLDLDAGTLSVSLVGVDKGVIFSGITGSWGPAGMVQSWGVSSGSSCVLITDPDLFQYTPPDGYGPWLVNSPRAVITQAPPTVADAVNALCVRSGLSLGSVDTTALSTITTPVRSLALSQIAPTRTALELLMTGFFFEMVVSDKIYFRPRGGSTVADIPYSDLGADTATSSAEPLPLLQANELEIPAQIALTYINIDNDYQADTQYSDRLISAVSGTVTATQMALGLTPSMAKAIADTMLADQAASVISTTIKLLGDYCRLEPTDVVNVAGSAGESFRLRLVKKTDSYPVLQFEGVVDVTTVLVSPGVTSVAYISSNEVLFPAVTLLELLDIPILSEADNDAGFYAASKGDTAAWPGAAVFQSFDDVEYSRKATIALAAVFGTCTTTLGPWEGGRVFDETNSVTVDVGNGQLQSSTRDALLNSQAVNAMMVGAEFLQYRNASLISRGVYKLTGFIRGGRGTEWAMTGHAAAERCVALTGTGMARIAMTNSGIGVSQFYKGVTLGGALSSATAKSFINTAVGLKPFSPVLVHKGRNAANNTIVLEWGRRTRLPTRLIGALGINVPLGEATEKYAVDFYDGAFAAQIGSIETVTPSLTLTGGALTASSSGGDPLAVSTSAASVAMQTYRNVNFWWRFCFSGDEWAAPSLSGIGLIVVHADGTSQKKIATNPDAQYLVGRLVDPFSMKTTPTVGWLPIVDGSPLTSSETAYDMYSQNVRDHRDNPPDVLSTTGRTARITFHAGDPANGYKAIYYWGTGFYLYDKSTLPGVGELGMTRTPLFEFYSAIESNFDVLAGGTTWAYTGSNNVSAVYPIDCVVFGNIIQSLVWGPLHSFNSAGKTVDITNLLNAHLDFASTVQVMTIRHTISGGVITPLDVRAGRFHADRINSTQAIEFDAVLQTASIVDMATGAISASVGCPFDIVAVAGDWTVGDVWYSIDTSNTIRKHNATGGIMATLVTGLFTAPYYGAPAGQEAGIQVSAGNVFFNIPSATSVGGGSYMCDKDLTAFVGLGASAVSMAANRADAGWAPIPATVIATPWQAKPDNGQIVAMTNTNGTFALAGSGGAGAVTYLPSPVGVRIAQISETVGKGYPLELVI